MEIENQNVNPNNGPLLPIWGSIPLYIIASFIFMMVFGAVFILLFRLIPQSDSIYYSIAEQFTNAAASLAGVWVCAIIFLKTLDRCPISELGMSIKDRWKDAISGILFATALIATGFIIILLLKQIEIISINFDPGVLLSTFMVYLVAAAMEEVMVRGYIQGRLMTKMNKFVALTIASLFFSLMHIFNSHIGILPLIDLFAAGLLLGASYMYTRNLWFPIFLHTAWNWVQGSVLGFEVSGTKMFPTAFELYLPEENIINGGSFGFEGSIVCTLLTLIGTALIIGWYERKKSKD